MRVKQLLVMPKLPESIRPLNKLARNLWYSWNWDAVKLFIRLDPDLWEACCQNPVEMLSRLPQSTLQKVAANEAFVVTMERAYEKLKTYQDHKKWFAYKYPEHESNPIAYFSLEYGLDTGLPVYSGGLGVLSGDTLKSASDIGLPMVAVGLLYRYGYFRQFLSKDGWQQERYEENDWYHMPVELVKDENDEPLRISLDLDNVPVQVQIWKVKVGLIPLYLLDTNLPENSSQAREITSVLYGGDKNMRIRQEIILGIGGARALKALGISPSLYHMNEGHSWFLTLERFKHLLRDQSLTLSQAAQFIWSTTVFTTHTPVPAGNEQFDPALVQRYLGRLVGELGLDWKEFLGFGRVNPDNESEPFGMTVAALKTSAFCNGVSKLHGKVSREMWHNIWPNLPKEEVPIKAITNGVHPNSWISHDLNDLFQTYFGHRYTERPGAPEIWKKINTIPDVELWRVHNKRRERLVFFARKLLKQQLVRQGASQFEVQRADQILNPQALTIGFARRFSTYKRGNLIFKDLDRLEKLVCNEEFPVQIIMSGKAHPLDNPGKEIIREIIGYTRDERFRNRIVFLEDYDINVARYLVQGSDIWLNTPRRPEEASGTSGMKAAFNGSLNLSILDGWWDEGYAENTGFKIGNGEEYDNTEVMNRLECDSLHNVLEFEAVPLFYTRNDNDLPEGWVTRMKAAIQMAGQDFSAQRMLMDYTNEFYVPAIRAGQKLQENNYQLNNDVADWLDRIKASWDQIVITELDIPEMGRTVDVGQHVPVSLRVRLGDLSPEDISVEIISGRLNSQNQLLEFDPAMASLSNGSGPSQPDEAGTYHFTGEIVCEESGRLGITARVLPRNENLVHTKKPKLIHWW